MEMSQAQTQRERKTRKLREIAEAAKCREYETQKALRALENYGLISVAERKRGHANRYTVHVPVLSLSPPDTEDETGGGFANG